MKYFFVLTLLCFGMMAQAQPQKVNYQAVAVNASGVTVKNRVISLKLSILDSSSIGSVLYSETHQPTTDGFGQFSVYLGGGTAVFGTFSNIPWGNTKDKFLKAEADLNGGTNYVLMGVSQVVSVPYALQAGSSRKADTSMVAKELEIGTIVRGINGETYSLNIGTNGPFWSCYPPVSPADAGADQLNICGDSVTLSGNSSVGMTPAWSILIGTGGSINGNTFTGLKGNYYKLQYTLTNACGTKGDLLEISFALPATLANAGPDQQIFSSFVNAYLSANTPVYGETGTWTIASGSGATMNDTNSPTAIFTKGTDSVYTLVWTISGPCGISRDTINLFFQTLMMNVPCPNLASVSYAGETYPTVQIGTQCWFQKNLNVGTMISLTNNQNDNNIIEKYCNIDNSSFCSIYGGLYRWAEAVQYQNSASNNTSPSPAFSGNVKGICPIGWHLPSDLEWATLEVFLGGSNIAGPALKSINIWDPNSGVLGTNASGFNALPGNSSLGSPGSHVYFWTSTEVNNTFAISRYLDQDFSSVFRSLDPKNYGFYVRCLKD